MHFILRILLLVTVALSFTLTAFANEWMTQDMIIMSKPPALPGDSQSLTFPGV